MDEIKITLEALYDMLRNEKKREDLQPLDKTFFLDVVTYLREKKAVLDVKKDNETIFAEDEQDKLHYELRSIRRILKELYEKREKKIIDIALNKSRTGSNIIDTSAMLPEEKKLYEHVLGTLDVFRSGIIKQLFQAQLPNVENTPSKPTLSQNPTPTPLVSKNEEEQTSPTGKTKVRFLHPTPSFVWKDMKVYGPFEEQEETEIFTEVANLLIRKGRAEKA